MDNKKIILVVEPQKETREQVANELKYAGYNVIAVRNGELALNCIERDDVAVIISEFQSPEIEGMKLLSFAKDRNPDTEVILLTDYGRFENAVIAMREGAYDFLLKPVPVEKLVALVEKIFEKQKLLIQISDLRHQIDENNLFYDIVGKSAKMQEIFNAVRQVAGARTSVLICGESGTGKELIAHAIHYNSDRKNKPFVKVSCASLSEGIIESELFGHEKGAFTDAVETRRGKFELADKGTLFLDEIGETSLHTQVKLLGVLQEREFERVGGEKVINIDARFIAATNKNLEELVKQKLFREDLYYRIKVVQINVPPLRERKDDIPLLVDVFLKRFSKENKKKIIGISPEAMKILINYHWPGNVRELQNCIEGMIVMCNENMIDVKNIPDNIRHIKTEKNNSIEISPGMSVEEVERVLIKQTLITFQGNKSKSAKALGISLRNLYRKIEKYGP